MSLDRLEMPKDVDAEMATIGCMFLDPQRIDSVSSIVRTEDFYYESHRTLFQVLLDLGARGTHPDIITVFGNLKSSGKVEKAGGPEYISRVMECVPTAMSADRYAQIVANKALLRRYISTQVDLVLEADSDPVDVQDFIERAETKTMALRVRRGNGGATKARDILRSTFAVLEERMKRRGEVFGVPSGLLDVDKMTGGWQPGDLVIVAGRPSMGKTAFAMNVAEYAACCDRQVPTLVFSLEMSKEMLMERMVAGRARVNSLRLRTGYLTDSDFQDLYTAGDALAESPLYIDDTGALSPSEIRNRARRCKAENGLGLVVVDYIQLMRAAAKSREQEVSECSRQLKALAKELDVPVVALSQLNRDLEKRPKKRPMLADLRESGAIEQDADVVAFVHRESVYDEKAPAWEAELIVAKQRNGPIGTVKLKWSGEFTRFDNLAPEGRV